jgi:hypothetical protein
MSIHEIFEAWAPADHPWSPWAKPVLFAHGPSRLTVTPPGELDQNALVWFESLRQRTAFVLDLPGIVSVNTAIQLAQHHFRPVPLFNTTDGLMPIVDVDEIRSQLFAQAEVISELQLPVDAPPVFMLDWCRKSGQHCLTPGHFDNRWVVFPQDFPSGRLLLENGIENVVIWQQDAGQPAEDLAHVARRWQEAGLAIWSKGLNPSDAPSTITVNKPAWYRKPMQRIYIAVGLRRNSCGGFGSVIPTPSSGG